MRSQLLSVSVPFKVPSACSHKPATGLYSDPYECILHRTTLVHKIYCIHLCISDKLGLDQILCLVEGKVLTYSVQNCLNMLNIEIVTYSEDLWKKFLSISKKSIKTQLRLFILDITAGCSQSAYWYGFFKTNPTIQSRSFIFDCCIEKPNMYRNRN